jgi:lactoylglutathione lyase
MTMSDSAAGYPYPVDYKSWLYRMNSAKPRFLHAALRVRSVEAALQFYVQGLGMTLLDRVEIESARATALFVGFGIDEGVLELVHFWDEDGPYTHSPGYIHAAIGVPDLNATLNRLRAMGVKITKGPTVVVQGAPAAAFLHDPDGYEVEIVQTRNDSADSRQQ